jgi:hypothetical protein
MPLYDAPTISARPVVGFGVGDIHVGTGASPDDGGKDRFLLIHAVAPGAIGSVDETGRHAESLIGISTEDRPADVAFYFAKPESVDQVLAALHAIRASFGEE